MDSNRRPEMVFSQWEWVLAVVAYECSEAESAVATMQRVAEEIKKLASAQVASKP